MPAGAPVPASRHAVLDLVRDGASTVTSLAERLGITDNAVRGHLVALERDGLVRRRGVVRSGAAGQPAAEYEVTVEGEVALSAAYPAALKALVAAAGGRLEGRALRALLQDAGRRLAGDTASTSGGTVAERAAACSALLDSLGGRTTLEASRRAMTLTGAGCPLAAAVRAEPGTCWMVQGLLEAYSGLTVRQACEHGDHPRCRFELST